MFKYKKICQWKRQNIVSFIIYLDFINNELEYNDEQQQRHFLIKMHSALQKKIWEISVFFVNHYVLIDYAQWLERLKGYKSKTELVWSWKEKSHFTQTFYIKCWITTPRTSNVNKKLWGPSEAALKKGNHKKSKKSQFSVLCYNCGKKGHIYFNCSHLLKDDAYWI